MNARFPLRIGGLLLLAAAPSADVTVFVGSQGGVGDVWVLSETLHQMPQRPASLQGIQLLDIDATGRTTFERLLPTVPILRSDIPGAARVVLPGGEGSLYRFRRQEAEGATFGFLVIRDEGPAVFAEMPGTGPQKDVDPILGRIAVSPAGDSFLYATTQEEGGNVFDVELTTGRWTQRTKLIGPLTIHPDSLSVLDTWGSFLTDQGAFRFSRTLVSAQVEAIPFLGHTPTWFGGEIVRSADQGTVAFAAGDGPTSAFVYTVLPTGFANQATTTAQSIVGGGFLPEVERGPMMSLSADGSRVAYTARVPEPGGGSDQSLELFVREVQAPSAVSAEQLTRDQNFEDTLNDSGVIAFVGEDLVVFMAGEDENQNGMEQADVFLADLENPSGSVEYTNLTATLGELVTPFDYGRLHSDDGVFLASDGNSVIVRDRGDSTSSSRLLRVPSQGGPLEVLLQNVREVELAENAGMSTYLTVRRSQGGGRTLVELPMRGPVRMSSAVDQPPTRLSVNRSKGRFAAILGTGQEFLGRIRASDRSGSILSGSPLMFGPSLDITESGAVVTSMETVQGTYFVVWAAGNGFRLLWPNPLDGFVLPAN